MAMLRKPGSWINAEDVERGMVISSEGHPFPVESVVHKAEQDAVMVSDGIRHVALRVSQPVYLLGYFNPEDDD